MRQKATVCTVYTDVAGIHRVAVEYDAGSKTVYYPVQQEELISFLEEDCWVELEDGTRIPADECEYTPWV